MRGVGEETAGRGDEHLVVRAMRAAFDVVGEQPPGLALTCDNAIPHGFGLGSSAAAIIAGLLAARALAGEAGLDRLPDAEVLRLATELEGHADNVAACLLGGLTIAWAAGGSVRSMSLAPLPVIKPVLCVPLVPLSTEVARQVLPSTVPHADAARNAARAALLVAALRGEPARLLDATEDFLHQPYRAGSMPGDGAVDRCAAGGRGAGRAVRRGAGRAGAARAARDAGAGGGVRARGGGRVAVGGP